MNEKNIEEYLDLLFENFGVHPIVNEKELRECFDLDLYSDLVYNIAKIMGLNNKFKVTYNSNPNHHYYKNSIKVIIMRSLMTRTSIDEFKSLRIYFEIESSLKKNFELFVKIITYELSDLLLQSKNYETNSESMVELCALVFGFDKFLLYPPGLSSLTDEQKNFAIACVEKRRNS